MTSKTREHIRYLNITIIAYICGKTPRLLKENYNRLRANNHNGTIRQEQFRV